MKARIFQAILTCSVCGDIFTTYRMRFGDDEEPLCPRCIQWSDEELHGVDPKTGECKNPVCWDTANKKAPAWWR